jgi:hypothetical protein
MVNKQENLTGTTINEWNNFFFDAGFKLIVTIVYFKIMHAVQVVFEWMNYKCLIKNQLKRWNKQSKIAEPRRW